MKKKISIIVVSCLCVGLLTVLSLLWKEKDDFNKYNNPKTIVGTFSMNMPSECVHFVFTQDGKAQRYVQFGELEEGTLKRIGDSNKYDVKFGDDEYVVTYHTDSIDLLYDGYTSEIPKISEVPTYINVEGKGIQFITKRGVYLPLCVCVPGMALIQSETNRPQVFTAKCSEPQASISDDMGGGSGVAILLSVRTET